MIGRLVPQALRNGQSLCNDTIKFLLELTLKLTVNFHSYVKYLIFLRKWAWLSGLTLGFPSGNPGFESDCHIKILQSLTWFGYSSTLPPSETRLYTISMILSVMGNASMWEWGWGQRGRSILFKCFTGLGLIGTLWYISECGGSVWAHILQIRFQIVRQVCNTTTPPLNKQTSYLPYVNCPYGQKILIVDSGTHP